VCSSLSNIPAHHILELSHMAFWNFWLRFEPSGLPPLIKGLSRSSSCPSRKTRQLKALSCYPRNRQVFENMFGWHIPQLTLLL
jgi:hypothetical protein